MCSAVMRSCVCFLMCTSGCFSICLCVCVCVCACACVCVCVSVVVTNSILFCLVQIDIPLSVVFYKWLLCQEHSLNSADLHHIDPVMARSFQQLETILHQKKLIYADQSHVSGWHRAGETGHKNFKKSL